MADVCYVALVHILYLGAIASRNPLRIGVEYKFCEGAYTK